MTAPPVFECDRAHVADYINARLGIQGLLPHRPNSFVMLGDSIIEQGPWSELMDDPHYINRGIGSATIPLIAARVPEIIALKPRRVMLSVGVNDINKGSEPVDVAAAIRNILGEFCGAGIETVWLSILPIARSFREGALNPKIEKTNEMIARLIDWDEGFLNLWERFVDDGALPDRLTYDGVHLNQNGYEIYRSALA